MFKITSKWNFSMSTMQLPKKANRNVSESHVQKDVLLFFLEKKSQGRKQQTFERHGCLAHKTANMLFSWNKNPGKNIIEKEGLFNKTHQKKQWLSYLWLLNQNIVIYPFFGSKKSQQNPKQQTHHHHLQHRPGQWASGGKSQFPRGPGQFRAVPRILLRQRGGRREWCFACCCLRKRSLKNKDTHVFFFKSCCCFRLLFKNVQSCCCFIIAFEKTCVV